MIVTEIDHTQPHDGRRVFNAWLVSPRSRAAIKIGRMTQIRVWSGFTARWVTVHRRIELDAWGLLDEIHREFDVIEHWACYQR